MEKSITKICLTILALFGMHCCTKLTTEVIEKFTPKKQPSIFEMPLILPNKTTKYKTPLI